MKKNKLRVPVDRRFRLDDGSIEYIIDQLKNLYNYYDLDPDCKLYIENDWDSDGSHNMILYYNRFETDEETMEREESEKLYNESLKESELLELERLKKKYENQ